MDEPQISAELQQEIKEAGLNALSDYLDDLMTAKDPIPAVNPAIEVSYRFKGILVGEYVGVFQLDEISVKAIELVVWTQAFRVGKDKEGFDDERATRFAYEIDPMILVRTLPDGAFKILRSARGN